VVNSQSVTNMASRHKGKTYLQLYDTKVQQVWQIRSWRQLCDSKNGHI